jgi:hypothetical protein
VAPAVRRVQAGRGVAAEKYFLALRCFTLVGVKILNRAAQIVKTKEAKIWQKSRQNVVKATPRRELGKQGNP